MLSVVNTSERPPIGHIQELRNAQAWWEKKAARLEGIYDATGCEDTLLKYAQAADLALSIYEQIQDLEARHEKTMEEVA